jgi:hypothetical protein
MVFRMSDTETLPVDKKNKRKRGGEESVPLYSHWKEYPSVPDFGEFNEPTNVLAAAPHSPEDPKVAWDVAARIRRKISTATVHYSTKGFKEKQMDEGTQASHFLNAVEVMEASQKKAKEKECTASASGWTVETMVALQVFYVPVATVEQVLPNEFLPKLDGNSNFHFILLLTVSRSHCNIRHRIVQ